MSSHDRREAGRATRSRVRGVAESRASVPAARCRQPVPALPGTGHAPPWAAASSPEGTSCPVRGRLP